MPAKTGFLDYVRAAFNARPFGMFVAPNWIGLGTFGLLGLMDPDLGAWRRPRARISAHAFHQSTVSARDLIEAAVGGTLGMERPHPTPDTTAQRRRPGTLRRACRACRSIIDLQMQGASDVPHGMETQADSLGRLSWMFLRLLVARGTILSVLGGGEDDEGLEQRRSALKRQASNESAARIEAQPRGADRNPRAAYRTAPAGKEQADLHHAELARIEEQVELIREQAALSTDPELLSRRIDEITATLGGTGQWIRDQQRVYGAMEDLRVNRRR